MLSILNKAWNKWCLFLEKRHDTFQKPMKSKEGQSRYLEKMVQFYSIITLYIHMLSVKRNFNTTHCPGLRRLGDHYIYDHIPMPMILNK